EPNVQKIRAIFNEIREKVISQITVRRTRKDLQNYPKYLEDLHRQGVVFPEISPLQTIEYQLDAKLSKLFYQTIFYLTDDDKVNYFRYQAIRFLEDDLRETYYDQAVLVSKSLAGIMKTLMVKRLESSFPAFRKTLNNLLTSTRRMIQMFEDDRILIAPDLNINELLDKGMSMDEIEQLVIEKNEENPKNNTFKKDDFKPEFLDGLKKDKGLLEELYKNWGEIKHDPKLDKFCEKLDNDFLAKDKNPTGQLVIFTESNDTANYLEEELRDQTTKGILKVSSANRNKIFDTIQANFDANYTGKRKDDIQILITTDVLAEGINLHRANVIVNYDTPWNATKLMQRTGRINRIGSVAGVVYNYIFYPSQQGDQEIKLYKNALLKLQGFHSAYGEDTQIFAHEELVEQFELFKEGLPDEEDKRLLYLRFIREFKDSHPKEFRRIQKFPLKARTARKNKNAARKEIRNNTLVFLKSPYKMDFYRVNQNNEVKTLTFIEAAEYFEAKAAEQGHHLPA